MEVREVRYSAVGRRGVSGNGVREVRVSRRDVSGNSGKRGKGIVQ